MIVLVFTIISLLLVVIQTSVCMLHPTWVAAPDLYYILLAYLAYRLPLMSSLVVLFFLGCFLDVFSGIILGMYALFCFSSFFLLRFIAQKMPVSESFYQVPLIGVSYLVMSWCAYVVTSFLVPGGLVEWVWWKMMLRTGLIVLCAYPLFWLLERIQYRLAKGIFSWKKFRVRTDNRYRA
ncbi:hypothetical protein [Desulfogranum mediterraneum]|uniref:hypothetical protein n=1 Tax=Desulfogranum mediterraneum TaxID=160661 RepID=UPI0004091F16|nr:hypothetical protein [Desulfogranum mediterraneum]